VGSCIKGGATALPPISTLAYGYLAIRWLLGPRVRSHGALTCCLSVLHFLVWGYEAAVRGEYALWRRHRIPSKISPKFGHVLERVDFGGRLFGFDCGIDWDGLSTLDWQGTRVDSVSEWRVDALVRKTAEAARCTQRPKLRPDPPLKSSSPMKEFYPQSWLIRWYPSCLSGYRAGEPLNEKRSQASSDNLY
jgi:hypothetical protein